MRLYLRSRVARKLKGKKLQAALADAAAKRAARSAAAERAVQTKVLRAEAAMEQAIGEQLENELSSWTWPRLVKAACASYNRGDGIPCWAYGKRDWADDFGGDASPDSDPEFLHRICCNFVRHQLLGYEQMLGGYVGSDAARDVAHQVVSEAVEALQHLTPKEELERGARAKAQERQRRASEVEQSGNERVDRVAKLVPWASLRQQQRIAEYDCTTLRQCLAAAKALGFQGDKKRWAGKI